jgi:hypothetical protein
MAERVWFSLRSSSLTLESLRRELMCVQPTDPEKKKKQMNPMRIAIPAIAAIVKGLEAPTTRGM